MQTTFQARTLTEADVALLETLNLPNVISNRRLHVLAARVAERMQQIEAVLSELFPRFQPTGQHLANIGSVDDLRIGCQAWSERTANQLFNNNVGHIEIDENGIATCTFFEEERDRGFLNRECRRIKHVHRVPNPKFLRVPAQIPIPPKGQEILRKLEVANLSRYVRILQGLLIGEQVTVDETWSERTGLGKAADATLAATKKYGKAALITGGVIAGGALAIAAAPLVLAGGAVSGTAAAVGGAMAPIAVTDPVICLGNVAIWGWTE